MTIRRKQNIWVGCFCW